MQSAYGYVDDLLVAHVAPASKESIEHLLVLHNRVHYGTNAEIMAEFARPIAANAEKFYTNIKPIAAWIWKHAEKGDHPFKIAAETYVGILGRPQLFVEGNHRTGSLIASWINLNGIPAIRPVGGQRGCILCALGRNQVVCR